MFPFFQETFNSKENQNTVLPISNSKQNQNTVPQTSNSKQNQNTVPQTSNSKQNQNTTLTDVVKFAGGVAVNLVLNAGLAAAANAMLPVAGLVPGTVTSVVKSLTKIVR